MDQTSSFVYSTNVTKNKGLSLKIQFIILSIFATMFLLFSFFVLIIIKFKADGLEEVSKQKELLTLAMNELSGTSKDLTRFSRLFIATQELKYKENYEFILKWRDGKIPRPNSVNKELFPGRTINTSSLFKELGAKEEELKLLDEATSLSLDLVLRERQAMQSIENNEIASGPATPHKNEDYFFFALRILHDDVYNSETEKINRPIQLFFEKLDMRISQEVNDLENQLKTYIWIITICLLFSIFLVCFIIIFLSHSVIHPIINVSKSLENISMGDGDLTSRLPIKHNNEIGFLCKSFNKTIEKIGSTIKSVDLSARTMEEIGSELLNNMTETASSVYEINSNIESVKGQSFTQAASVTQTAATIEEIIRTIKTLNGSIECQVGSVAVVSSSIEEMVANIKSITDTLEKSDELIKELGMATSDGKEMLATSHSVTKKIAEESGSLMEASSVIQHIAAQTNLLAMNAAIEAAHAGEKGKGFAVVAAEIRKLAEESATQGKTITATLKSLSAEIEGLSNSSRIVETKFNAIFDLSKKVGEISARLTEAMREQENGSNEVLTAIKDINQVTQQVSMGSTEMLKGSETVAVEMQKLDGLTRIITDSMNEMAVGASQISNAVNEVAEISNKNKTNIDSLVEEVGRFKITRDTSFVQKG